MRKNHYLVKNRFGIYYYRVITPQAVRQLVPQFKHEVRISLDTRSVREASEKSTEWHLGFTKIFRELTETGQLKNNDDEKRMIRSLIEREPPSPAEPATPEQLMMALVEEDIKNRSYARHLFYLLERKGQLAKMVEDYKNLINPDFEFAKLKLDTPKDIEKVISIVELLQDPLLQDKRNYLMSLPLRKARQRNHISAHGGHKDAKFGSISKRPKALPAKDFKAPKTKAQIANEQKFTRNQLLQVITKIAFDSAQGKESDFVLETDDGEIVFKGVKIDTPEDIELIQTMLGQYFHNALPQSQSVVVENNSAQNGFRPSRSLMFSELAKFYYAERSKTVTTAQGISRINAAIDMFMEVVGDKKVELITQEDVDEIVHCLNHLPPNRKKDPKYRDLTVKQILAIVKPTDEKLGSVAINHYLTELLKMFDLAIKRRYVAFNPFDGARVMHKKRKNSEERADKDSRRFDENDLIEIFSQPTFTENTASRSWHFWLPLLCCYTGARIAELAQLDWKDVYQMDGVWVIDINAKTHDKSLKTESSNRLVPIHDTLLKLNFHVFAQDIAKAAKLKTYDNKKLFWDLRKGRDSWSHYPGKWFSDSFMKGLTANRPGDKFHAFRHQLTYLLKNAGVDESTYGAILGHDISLRSGGMYGDRHELTTLQKAINKAQPLPSKVVKAIQVYQLPREFQPKNNPKEQLTCIDMNKSVKHDTYLLKMFKEVKGPQALFTE
jgi:integrase